MKSLKSGNWSLRWENLILEVDSQGHSTETGKWDNHNAIARGWKTVEEAYHPVTFRKIYGVGRAGSIHSTASAPQLSPFSQNPDQQFQDEEPEQVDDRSELWLISILFITNMTNWLTLTIRNGHFLSQTVAIMRFQ